MSIQIRSGASTDLQTIDPVSKASRVTLYDSNGNILTIQDGVNVGSNQPGIPVGGYNDNTFNSLRTDRSGAVATKALAILLQEDLTGTSVNASKWVASAATMVSTFSTTEITINSGAITTINTNYALQSLRRFNRQLRSALEFRARARVASGGSNSQLEMGFGDSTGATATQNGAYFQVQPNGSTVPVVSSNGTVIFVGTPITSGGTPIAQLAQYFFFDVTVNEDSVVFNVQNSDGSSLNRQVFQIGSAQARLWLNLGVPVVARAFITGTAATTAPQLRITELQVSMSDQAGSGSPSLHQDAMAGRTAGANPLIGGATQQWVNSTAPANATLSNTAAGYTTLGGLFSFAAVVGQPTDYALFGFTVPSPYQLVVTEMVIESWNTGAAVASTPTLMVWAAAHEGTSVSLAAGAHLKQSLGVQSFPIGAVVGAKAERIGCTFGTPLVTSPGRFFNVILRMPVGTATVSQVVQGLIQVNGYFR